MGLLLAICKLLRYYNAKMIRTEYPYGKEFPILHIQTPLCEARISLVGAHIMQWQPLGAREVFFMSPELIVEKGRALRGGVPLCWPWFGQHPTDPQQSPHGVARTALWTHTQTEENKDGSIRIVLILPPLNPKLPSAAYVIELGEELIMSLLTLDIPHYMPFSAAQHIYFAVSDYEQVAITGLEDCPFIEYASAPEEHCEDPLIAAGNIDRIYQPVGEEREIIIHDPAWQRSIKMMRLGSGSCIVWNPGAQLAAGMNDLGAGNHRGFIAVESSVVPAENRYLKRGDIHTLTTRIQIIPIS